MIFSSFMFHALSTYSNSYPFKPNKNRMFQIPKHKNTNRIFRFSVFCVLFSLLKASQNVGRLGKDGLQQANEEIIRIMVGQ